MLCLCARAYSAGQCRLTHHSNLTFLYADPPLGCTFKFESQDSSVQLYMLTYQEVSSILWARHMMSKFIMALLQYVYRWNGVDAALMC